MTMVNLDNSSATMDLIIGLAQKYASPGFERRSSPRGTILYHQGDRPSGLYLVHQGLASLSATGSSGHEMLLRLFSSGEIFGHRALLGKESHHATLLTLENLDYSFLPPNRAQLLIQNSTDFLLLLTKKLARELGAAEKRMVDYADKNVKVRIIESLLFLKQRHPNHQWTRKEIGEFAGAQQETVTRVLSSLEKMNLIHKKGREILIPSPSILFQKISHFL